ncbi:LOW QUALITY PROTEIN: hypothetical protein TorRG33x02_340140, partial [Trema orientale]
SIREDLSILTSSLATSIIRGLSSPFSFKQLQANLRKACNCTSFSSLIPPSSSKILGSTSSMNRSLSNKFLT